MSERSINLDSVISTTRIVNIEITDLKKALKVVKKENQKAHIKISELE